MRFAFSLLSKLKIIALKAVISPSLYTLTCCCDDSSIRRCFMAFNTICEYALQLNGIPPRTNKSLRDCDDEKRKKIWRNKMLQQQQHQQPYRLANSNLTSLHSPKFVWNETLLIWLDFAYENWRPDLMRNSRSFYRCKWFHL